MWSLQPCGEGTGNLLQYSCLENPTDGGAWWVAVHGVEKSQTRLSDFTFTFHFHALEKEMATHSSVLAWRISGTGEPGGLPSIGSHRVGHDWSDLAAAATAMMESHYFPILTKKSMCFSFFFHLFTFSSSRLKIIKWWPTLCILCYRFKYSIYCSSHLWPNIFSLIEI